MIYPNGLLSPLYNHSYFSRFLIEFNNSVYFLSDGRVLSTYGLFITASADYSKSKFSEANYYSYYYCLADGGEKIGLLTGIVNAGIVAISKISSVKLTTDTFNYF